MPGSAFARRVAFYGGSLLALAGSGFYAISMPGASHAEPLPAPPATVPELARQLRAHVIMLASIIGERNTGEPEGLDRARDYIAAHLRQMAGSRGTNVAFESLGPEGLEAQNVIFELPGQSSEIVVVGAHYDSAPGTPGANDNASGVAVALALAEWALDLHLHHSLRIAFFANEEPHFFQNPGMGSLVHARASRRRGDRIRVMLSLESLGFYSDAPGSQRYPWPFGLMYPDRGNFVAFVGNLSSRGLVRETIGIFRATTQFPSEGAALPSWIPGVGWSDHWSFWKFGYPALMITDTAVFRDPDYHHPSDVAANLNYERMARVTVGLFEVVAQLADPE